MGRQSEHFYEFGPFRLDASEHLLLRDGQPVVLTPKAFDTLLLLVENGDHLLSKEELMNRLWPDTVVEEANLTNNISLLRKALGEGPHGQRYIQTVPRRGYRFVAGVRRGGDEAVAEGDADSGEAAALAVTPAVRPPRAWRRAKLAIWPAALLLLLAGGAAWFYFFRPATGTSLPPMKTTPFTSFLGREGWPAFSPDGNQLAFTWNGGNGDDFDIYVRIIGAEGSLRLTAHPGIDHSPAWSADGRHIAFTRTHKGESAIFLVPALGGPERKLLSLGFRAGWLQSYPMVAWSPDGKLLAFPDQSSPHEPPGIFLLSVENLERRRLTSAPPDSPGDWFPAFSPDGQTLAFARSGGAGWGDLYAVPVGGGEPQRLTFDNTWVRGLDWTPDGGIVWFSFRGGSFRLWKVSVTGGSPEPLAAGGDTASLQFDSSPPSISRRGNRLAYAQSSDDTNIWRVELSGPMMRANSPAALISSTQHDSGPQFSSDGNRIAFHSARSGVMEIWVSDSAGLNPVQLTFLGGPLSGTPRWSPDDRQIAFDATLGGAFDIYVINAEGGTPRRITTERSNDAAPSWSRDGRWIYFGSNRTGEWQVWKAPAEGGEAVQVTKRGGFAAFESPDGKFVYYAKYGNPGLWKVPANSGEESLVLASLPEGYWGYWAVVDEGIYFVNPGEGLQAGIEFFSFATRRVSKIGSLGRAPVKWDSGFAVSPDKKWLLYSQYDQAGSDIVLVENFR